MSRKRVSAGLFGPGPGQAFGGAHRINLGTFGGDEGPDLPGFLAEDPNRSASSGERAALDTAKQTNANNRDFLRTGRMAPLPNMGWDSFFDALQLKELRAKDHGLRFKTDIVGKGPGSGTGFGTWAAQDLGTGKRFNLDQGEMPPGLLPTAQRNAHYKRNPDEAASRGRAVQALKLAHRQSPYSR